jgi:hypothetical protein
MEKEFIPYEQALELKELGFDEPCFCYWYTQQGSFPSIRGKDIQFNGWKNYPDSNTIAPLYQQAFRWFREKHNLLGGVYSNASGWLWEIHDNIGGTHRFGCDYEGDCEHSGTYTSFDKAELACLKKLIEIVKKNEL